MMRCLLLPLLLTALAADEFRVVAPGITLAIPDGWTQTKAADGGSVVVRSPLAPDADGPTRNAGASIAISVEAPRAGRDSQTVLDEALATLRRLAPEFTVVDVPTTVEVGGRSWRRASYRFTTGELVWMQSVMAVADAQGVACITCSSDGEHFAGWQPFFTRALAGLEYKASRLGQ
jgi:hypothetical protein